jgi:predicted nucleic acid-binding protein
VLVLTPLVIHEFLHVVTDARRFEPPIEMTVALTLARSYLDRSNVEWLAVDEAAIASTIELMRTKGLGRKRIADTLLVGTLLGHGVGKLATCDPEHFAGFDGLELIDPR